MAHRIDQRAHEFDGKELFGDNMTYTVMMAMSKGAVCEEKTDEDHESALEIAITTNHEAKGSEDAECNTTVRSPAFRNLAT